MGTQVTRQRRLLWVGISASLVGVLIALAVVPAAFAQGTQGSAGGRGSSDSAMLLFEQVYEFVQRNYVDEVEASALVEGALRGMFEALEDPHSAYLDVEEMRDLTDTTSGEFGGVGMFISKPIAEDGRASYVEVVSPIEDTPAFRAGLRAGDRITEVEGETTADLTIDEVVNRLRGRPGSEVNITIRRGEDLNFPVALERALIQVPTVKHALIDDSIAFLRVIQFTPFTEERVREAIGDFEAAGYESMIIDLRSNPGGLLSGVVDVADLFFDGGLIVETRGRVASENQSFNATSGTTVSDDIEIVVLIDDGSASAAEILAGALKDRDRAVLMGQTTYGKGSVQQVRRIGQSGFRLTMSRYYTPSGTEIDQVGISPDIEALEPELSSEEQQAYARIREERRIIEYVEQIGEPDEADLQQFFADLRADGIDLSDRTLRRLVRIEVNRVLNRTEVYDLDYDLVLRRAVEYLRS